YNLLSILCFYNPSQCLVKFPLTPYFHLCFCILLLLVMSYLLFLNALKYLLYKRFSITSFLFYLNTYSPFLYLLFSFLIFYSSPILFLFFRNYFYICLFSL